MEFTIFRASCIGNETNCVYPKKCEIRNAEDLKQVANFDHVCAEFKNNYRGRENFISADVLVMDCDNNHTDNPEDWMTKGKLLALLPDVPVAIVPSRHNDKPKNGKCARPRFHAYFMIPCMSSEEEYAELKKAVFEAYPFFDEGALDSSRFLYGTQPDYVVWQDGSTTIDQMVCAIDTQPRVIPEGQRNSTMSRFAGRVIKRYGATEKAYQIFFEEAEKCDPPLSDEELNTIWRSALKFGEKVAKQEGYISPEQYNNDFGSRDSLKPEDYSDIGQAKVIAREYGNELRYTDGTDFIRYNGIYWDEFRQASVRAAEEFLDLQLADAKDQMENAMKALVSAGIAEEIIQKGGRTLEKAIEASQRKNYEDYLAAVKYYNFVMKRRDMRYVLSALQALKPMVYMKVQDLDNDEFLLNTPSYTYDLRKGMEGKTDHKARDFITKCTTVDPGDKGKDIWEEAIFEFFVGDQELVEYAQEISGLMAIGKVYVEALVIAYGDGRNGKSTFWNSLSRVLGSYCGGISADALTAGCKRNIRPEMAELKGKRMIIAAEMEEGMRLSTSILKQLCSTDEVSGEKKYKDPFKFIPTHTLVLYTNHLPRVGASDEGTWRRLIVIPFEARFEGKEEVKNYSDYLVENAGPAILEWIIEGARKVIAKDYHLTQPKCVQDSIKKYREDNNWFQHFLEDCCDVGPSYKEKSGDLYAIYRSYCQQMNEFTRSTTDFYGALENAGFERRRNKSGRFFYGLKLKVTEFL